MGERGIFYVISDSGCDEVELSLGWTVLTQRRQQSPLTLPMAHRHRPPWYRIQQQQRQLPALQLELAPRPCPSI